MAFSDPMTLFSNGISLLINFLVSVSNPLGFQFFVSCGLSSLLLGMQVQGHLAGMSTLSSCVQCHVSLRHTARP